MKIKFLGAAKTVTGSKTLIEFGNRTALIDSGMYQGVAHSQELNSESLDIDIHNLEFIFLTHGHLDHCGYLPILVKNGFKGRIFCSEATKEIVQIILEDSVRVQNYDLKDGKISQIYYDEYDVEKTLSFIETRKLNYEYSTNDLKYRFYEAGHIIGATSVVLEYEDKRIAFSGDIGREGDILHKAPNFPKNIDYLVLESTYGNREHPFDRDAEILMEEIKRVKETRGVLLIPAFAVARTQALIQIIHNLFIDHPEYKIPVYVDSPMGVKVTRLYQNRVKQLKIAKDDFEAAIDTVKLMEFGNDFKKFERAKKPFILISSSGMISGGKVLKYFDMYAKHENNTVLLSGFQAPGTIGNMISTGETKIKLLGHTMNVRAKVTELKSLSAHADQGELLKLVKTSGDGLKKIFLNHGEEEALTEFRDYLIKELDIEVQVANKNKFYELGEIN